MKPFHEHQRLYLATGVFGLAMIAVLLALLAISPFFLGGW